MLGLVLSGARKPGGTSTYRLNVCLSASLKDGWDERIIHPATRSLELNSRTVTIGAGEDIVRWLSAAEGSASYQHAVNTWYLS